MNRTPRITVLGSLNMDISVTVPRLPGPGATVLGGAARFTPGGKGANQAVAAARLGAQVRMVGCVGEDDFGNQMTASLEAEGIDVRALARLDKVPSGLAMITVDGSGENIITVAPGANGRVGEAQVDSAVGTPYDALVISAEIPVAAVRLALARAPRGVTCVLNLAPAPPAAAAIVAGGVDWLVVNESEAAAVLGQPVRGMDEARKAAVALVAAGARNAVVTAGPHGAAMAGAALAGPGSLGTGGQGGARAEGGAGAQGKADGSGSDVLSAPVFKVDAVDSVGAGDTFVGAFAVALAAGVRPFDAVVAASAAGATAVTRHGAQAGMPRPADVLAATGTAWPLA